MKIKYTCETCEKQFDTQEDAKRCEAEHELAKRRKKLKKESEEALSSLINSHIKTFGEVPFISLSDENLKVLEKSVENSILEEFRSLEDTFISFLNGCDCGNGRCER